MNLRAEAVQAHNREIDRLENLLAAGHRLLRFPRDIEKEFEQDYARRFLLYRRRVVLLAVIAVLAAGFFDYLFVAQEVLGRALFLRYVLFAPLALAVLAYSQTRIFERHQQRVLGFFGLSIAALQFGLMHLGDDRLVLIYSPGILLLALFAGLLLHLRFLMALAVLTIVGVFYVLFIVEWRPQALEIVVAYTMFYTGGSLMALFSGYFVEYTARQQFLQERLLALKQNELELANHQLQEMVHQDGLTGIANRRHFDQQFEVEWSRAQRGGYPLALLLIDIDAFKKYNDTYGHQAGDDCLIVVGSVLRSHAQRSGDIAARYGGEEFAMILPVTTREDAEEIGWRVVKDIARFAIPHRASDVADVVTASVGVACAVPSPMLMPRDLLAAADGALYRAKDQGRNRVEVAVDVQPAGEGS